MKIMQPTMWTVQGFCPDLGDFQPASLPATVGHIFQVFSPEPHRHGFSTLKIGGNRVVSPWDPLLSTQRPPYRVLRQLPACAHMSPVRTYMCTFLGTPQEGLQVDSRGPQELTTWYPPVFRGMNPFAALVCPSFKVSVGLWSENTKLCPKSPQNAAWNGSNQGKNP